jgi:hypothetical protein
MNLINFTQTAIPSRLFAGITIVSLFLSALPVAFFTADAAIQSVTIGVQMVPNPITGNDTITLTNPEIFPVTLELLTINDLAVTAMYGPSDLVIAANSSETIDVSSRLNQDDDDVTFSGTNVTSATVSYAGTPADDAVVVGSFSITADDGVPAGTVYNDTKDLYYVTIEAAVAAADDGDLIELTTDIEVTDEVVVNKDVTIDGLGNTVTTNITFESSSQNNSVFEIIGVDGVSLVNFTLDGSGGTNIHGINIYEATNVALDDLVVTDNQRSAVVVNSSQVVISNIETANNGFTGPIPNFYQVINVAKNTPEAASLEIKGVSVHAESKLFKTHVFADTLADVTFADTDTQYERVFNILIPSAARAFILKEEVVEASLEITNPATDGALLMGSHTFEALYMDDDETIDTINWAVKTASCEANNTGVNVAGFGTSVNPPINYDPVTGMIDVTVDLSEYSPGEYCFVVNPAETGGQTDTDREVRTFVIEDFATVYASKIVCDYETELPNMSGGADITATTASDWLAANLLANPDTSCRMVDGWEFEWSSKGVSVPSNYNNHVGYGGAGWNIFTDSAMIPASAFEGIGHISLREVLLPDYIGFGAGGPFGVPKDIGAELYCASDVTGYDNLDRINKPIAGEDYYCVGWNQTDPEASLEITSPESENQVLSGFHTFTAEYMDDDTTVDKIQWAIRPGVCESSSINLAGNVGGLNTPSTFVGSLFSTDVDMTGWDDGAYCFVVNPSEQSGEDDLREVRSFVIDTPVVYAPYCGDGQLNQEWEVCEVGTDGCTDYCTYENQCTNLQLMKVTLDEDAPVSTTFDNSIRLGSVSNIIPNGTWFNFAEVGDETAQSVAQAAEGLAVERTGTELRLAVEGGNSRTGFDYVFGTVMTQGIALGVTDSSPIPGWELETTGNYVDIWDKNDTEGLDFKMWLTSGDDAGSVAVTAGEEYNCSECKATVEARIVHNDSGVAGDGDLSAKIILGDAGYSTVEFGEWFPISVAANVGDSAVMITDPNTVTNFASASDKSGLFVSRENGTVKVALYGEHAQGGNANYEWIDARIEVRDAGITNYAELSGDYKFENHPENNGVPTNDGYDTATVDTTGVDFKLWVDTGSDGFRFDIDSIAFCEDDTIDRNPEIDLFEISGTKYVVEGESETAASGWTIYASNGVDTPLSTTTDTNGNYSFTVAGGVWEVYEENRTDWQLVDIFQVPSMYYEDALREGEIVELAQKVPDSCEFNVGISEIPVFSTRSSEFISEVNEISNEFTGYTCNFHNEYTPEEEEEEEEGRVSSGSSSGTRISLQAATPQGLVLGASTDSCPFLVDYLQMGAADDEMEVMKLQLFLNIFKDLFGGTANPITGTFGATTDVNVKAFQERYRSEILDPWFNLGIVPHNRATGFVYKTTLWKINDIVCPESAVLPEFTGESLSSNVAINFTPIED